MSTSTHRQVLSAWLFLYQKVLAVTLPWMDELARPVPKKRIPVVLTQTEVQAVLSKLEGTHKLLASLLYGCGMRLMEGLRLRVKDVDFDRKVIIVRDGKGGKDRVVMLPQSIVPALQDQFRQSHTFWAQDRAQQLPGVEMPHALDAKYPKAGQTWAWHWVFAQATVSTDPRSKTVRRHHAYDQTFQRAFKLAVQAALIVKPATPQPLRFLSFHASPTPGVQRNRSISSQRLGCYAASLSGTSGSRRLPRTGKSATGYALRSFPRANSASKNQSQRRKSKPKWGNGVFGQALVTSAQQS